LDNKVNTFLNKTEEIFCGLALLSTTIILFINVVLRYFFRSSTSWAEELIRYLMVWTAFIGSSICVRKGIHVGIDFFLQFIDESKKLIVARVINSICAVFSVLLTWYSWQIVSFNMSTGQVTPALGIPMYIPYMAAPIGFGLMTIRFIQTTFRPLT